MTGRPSVLATRAMLSAFAVAMVAALALSLAVVAHAFWGAQGSGVGSATTGTLDPPTAVTISSFGPTVTVNWTGATPPEGTLAGYTVTRYAGATPSNACGTDPATPGTFIQAGTLTCSDTLVPDGTYAYTVTAVFRSWTAQSAQSNAITVVGDQAKPNQSVVLAPGATNAHFVGATLYYRATASGSFQLVDTVTGVASAPASAAFPNIGATGWTHPAETVTSGTGTTPTITYTSSSFAWTPSPANPATYPVTGADTLGNTVSTQLSFTSDTTGPTGGSLTVNATAASAGGTTSTSNASFSINVRTDYSADLGAGLATSVLTREPATLTNSTCGAFGAVTTIIGSPAQTGLATGCYRYTLTGTDNVGNVSSISTIVTYDTGLPTQAATLTAGVGASQTGNVIYFRNTVPGSFSLSDAVTDTESGPASATFPLIATAGWTHLAQTVSSGTGSPPTIAYASSTYSFGTGASTPGAHSVVGKDVAGNPVTTALTFTKDVAAPTGGALTVNGVAASTAGSLTFNKTGGFAIDSRTDYATDTASGVGSSVLTMATAPLSANTCGAYGTASVIIASPAQSGLTTGCWKYVLTGTDKVGNVATPLVATVKVDLVVPTTGALTVNALAASGAGTTSGPTKSSFPINSRTDYTDAESGIKTSTLTRQGATLTAGVCGTFTGTITTLVGTPLQTGLATSCYKYTLTGTDNALNATSISTIVQNDITAPTGGALTVNSVAASTAGTSSTTNAGSFTIGTRTDFTDAASGIGPSVLTVATAPLSANTCGTYGTPATISGSPAQSGLTTGCWTYVLTGTDQAGNVATTTTTVKVDLLSTTGGAVTVNGLAASAAGTTGANTNAATFPIDSRTDFTDAESGLKTSTLTRQAATLTAGLCGTFTGTVTTLVGTPLQTGLATSCYKYTLTGTDNALNATGISTIVKYDVTAPTAGTLTVNGTGANVVGTSSTANAASFTIGTRTANTDAASGLASSTLTRQLAPLSGSTCGSYGSITTITGTPAQTGLATGCYLYTLTGIDNAGNSTSIATTVKLGVYVTAASLTNGTGTAGRPDQGDRMVVTFSDQLDVSTLCSTWSGNSTDQIINGDNQATVTLNNIAGSDTVTVSSSGCTLNFGTLSLGSAAYTTAPVTFAGAGANKSTIAWSWSAKQLTITLGQVSGAGPATVATSIVTYTPSTSLLNVSGVPTGGTFVTANVGQF